MSGQKKNNSAWRRVLKRHWKLFFVVFFLLGGLGNIGRNINTVIFCFFLAIVFLCWWQLKRREEIEAKELAEWTKTYEAEKKKKAAEKKPPRPPRPARATKSHSLPWTPLTSTGSP